MSRKALRSYQTTQVSTAKPEKILLMLYEGCIKFVRIAKTRMEENNIAEKGKNIGRAIAIISEFINTLDHDIGGQLSKDLEGLYSFMIDRLIEANIKNITKPLEDVDRLLCTLYDGWKDVIENPRPDGVPSKELQADLYSIYEQQKNLEKKSTE